MKTNKTSTYDKHTYKTILTIIFHVTTTYISQSSQGFQQKC